MHDMLHGPRPLRVEPASMIMSMCLVPRKLYKIRWMRGGFCSGHRIGWMCALLFREPPSGRRCCLPDYPNRVLDLAWKMALLALPEIPLTVW